MRVGGRGKAVCGLVGLATVMAMLAGACSSDATEDGGDGPDGAGTDWVAAELSEVPEGLIVCEVRESSSQGRVVAYVHEAEGAGDNCEVTVTASTSLYGWTLDEAIAIAQESSSSPVAVTEVGGHPAVLAPMTDEGRAYGRQVVWEQAPGLVIQVQDARYDGSQPVATDESLLDLASQVVGMDRARWDAAVLDFDSSYPYAGPPSGSVEEQVASGEVDGRPWTLSAWIPQPSPGPVPLSCRVLVFAGESTGPGCAPEWAVLAGVGFVTGFSTSPDAPISVRAGTSAAPVDDPRHVGTIPAGSISVEVQGFPVDDVGEQVWVAVVPPGMCTVVLGDVPSAGAGSRQLWLLPGDPGAAACAGR